MVGLFKRKCLKSLSPAYDDSSSFHASQFRSIGSGQDAVWIWEGGGVQHDEYDYDMTKGRDVLEFMNTFMGAV